MKVLTLDRTLDLNTEYKLRERIGFVVKKIGTNVDDEVKLIIDNKPCVPFHGAYAPLADTGDNTLGMLDLGPYYIPIPPETTFTFQSPSSGKIRLVGDLLILDATEDFPAEHATRFKEMLYKGISYIKVTVSTSGATWAEDEVLKTPEIEPDYLETYKLNDVVMIKPGNVNIDWGMVGVGFIIDNTPVEFIYNQGAKWGIDVMKFPYPPNINTNIVPFTLKDSPIILTKGHKLQLELRNVSGGSISSADGSNPITFTILFKIEYERVPYTGSI